MWGGGGGEGVLRISVTGIWNCWDPGTVESIPD